MASTSTPVRVHRRREHPLPGSALLPAATVLGVQVGALLVLWRLRHLLVRALGAGWGADPELVLVGSAYVATGLTVTAMWTGTMMHCVGRLLRLRGLVRASRLLLPHSVRRIIDGATAVATASTIVTAGPALALPPPGMAPIGASEPAPVSSSVPQPAPEPSMGPAARPAADTRPAREDADVSAHGHVVDPGEHLWSISVRHLRTRAGREPTVAEVAAYWSRVVQHNRARLVSGDPDLIFPGERIELPE